ncbi:LemA family protein [Flavobacterium aquidurense]|uniref:LemA family protein n=1 Tax=Flavobacterium aquidurense TaxID=362413 RepID=UPI002857751C|nr:LemA family protein [Flavobacterium aquidurense]MDR7372822.1 hypothetical protein [Flavobacterium aquidurense]
MKNIIVITIIFLFQNLNIFAQDQSEINQKWTALKEQFKVKTEIVLEFKSKVQKSKKIDKSELEQTLIYANELKKICENEVLNKEEVTKVKQTNDSLNIHLVRILVSLESDIKLKSEKSIIFLYDRLTEIENQILVTVKKYNEVCIKQNRKELIFLSHGEDRSPSVEF